MRAFAALSVRNYRWYVAGALVANTATWMQRVAQDWMILGLTDNSAIGIGVATALQFLPFLIFSPLSGAIADRIPRRTVIAVAGGIAFTSAVAMAVISALGIATLGLVFANSLLIGIAFALDNPARQAFAGDLVGTDGLANAVALNAMASNVARIGGPAVAGLVIAGLGLTGSFALNAALFVIAIVTLVGLHMDELVGSGRAVDHQATVREGLAHIAQRPVVIFVILTVMVFSTFGLNLQLTMAIMARDTFHVSAAGFGVMGACLALGSFAGSYLSARRRQPTVRLVAVAACAFAVIEVAVGLVPTYTLFLLTIPLCGLLALTVLPAAQSLAQLGVDRVYRGRVMGIYSLVMFGGAPFFAPIIGIASDHVGARFGLVGGGLLTAIGMTVILLVMRRRLDWTGVPEQRRQESAG